MIEPRTPLGAASLARGARTTAVRVERSVDAPFSFTLAEVDRIFTMLESSGPGLRVPLRALGLPFDGALAHRVSTHFHRQPDLTERGRLHDEIAFEWSAKSRWLPHFKGSLRMRIEAVGTRLVMQGDYVAPFGILGVAFDRLIGRRLAEATAADVLERLVRELTNRWTVAKRAS